MNDAERKLRRDERMVQTKRLKHSVQKSSRKPHTSTRASTLRFGDRVGFTPLAASTSSGVRASTGFGLNRSSGSLESRRASG